MMSVKQEGIKYHFWVFGMIRPVSWTFGEHSNRLIPQTQKMVLDDALLSAEHYKVRIKGKVNQS